MEFLIDIAKGSVPPHEHKKYEVIVCVKGTAVMSAEEKKIEVVPGKIIIVPPETTHYSFKQSDDYERIYINGEFNQSFFLRSPVVVFDSHMSEGVYLAKMIYANRYADREYLSALISAFTHYLLQYIKMEDEIFLAVKEIIREISNNFYSCNINLNELLKKSGYAEDYIRAQFKKISGKTPTQFLTEVRINHACYLIDTYKSTFSLADIAEKCGYADYVYFSRRFKYVTGVSPRKYMESN